MEDASGDGNSFPTPTLHLYHRLSSPEVGEEERDEGLPRRQWVRGGLRTRVHGILAPALPSGLGQANVSPWASVSPLTLEP